MIEIPEVTLPALGNLELVRSRFQACPSLPLGQDWLSFPEPEFESGLVTIGRDRQNVLIFAELQDSWIHNWETEHNAHAYLHGDTFEIFLRNQERDDYWELHVTPQNVIFQAHFPKEQSVLRSERGPYNVIDFLVDERKFVSNTWVGDGVWNVLARVPLALLGLPVGESGSLLSAHFARYDYPKGRSGPVLSSTARHSGPPNFHDQNGWSCLSVGRRVPLSPKQDAPLTGAYGC
ncbi:hypothetical protein BH09VER1_BH09VER1_36300 [soil metagenome]